jgi:hypothetical protein
MEDRINNDGAEKGGFELLCFCEIVGSFAARLRESEIGARRYRPGCLEHRDDFRHEPCLRGRDRIRVRRRPVQHILQQEGLLGSGRHALAVDRVEPTERIGDWQHTAGQARQSFEMLPGAHREAMVAHAVRRMSVTERVVHSRRDQ